LVHKRVPERRPKVAKRKKFTSPSYLQSTPHGYYFQYKTPPDFRSDIGHTELKCSLRTGRRPETKEHLAKPDYHNVSKPVEWLLADNGLDVNKQSESFKRLCREMLKVEVKLLEIAKRTLSERTLHVR